MVCAPSCWTKTVEGIERGGDDDLTKPLEQSDLVAHIPA